MEDIKVSKTKLPQKRSFGVPTSTEHRIVIYITTRFKFLHNMLSVMT